MRDRSLLAGLTVEERTRLLSAAGDVFNPDLVQRRQWGKTMRRQQKRTKLKRDETVLAETGIRVLREKPVFTTPNVFPPDEFEQQDVDEPEFREVVEPQHCYVCKRLYRDIHPFYDQLCPECARLQLRQADRDRRPARAGRAPHRRAGQDRLPGGDQAPARRRAPRRDDALPARRGGAVRAGGRLRGVGRPARGLRARPAAHAERRGVLPPPELRRTTGSTSSSTTPARPCAVRPSSTGTCSKASDAAGEARPRECRKRCSGGYRRVLARRRRAARTAGCRPSSPTTASDLFPEGRLDQDLQQVDLRDRNSWRLLLAEVSSVELLETQLVNAVAPFVLNARLKPLMLKTPERDKHIVNVSAVEGQFYRRFKTTRHPHTNMAKAALNMMTRTSAADYHADGIHMNSVDTGWVTRRGSGRDRRAEDGGAPVPPAARHRRRRGPDRRSDHRRLQHRRARLGPVPEGLPPDRLVSDRLALGAFSGAVVVGGSNFVAVRYSNRELDPLWGAGLRFGLAAVVFGVLVRGAAAAAPARARARPAADVRTARVRRRVRVPLLGDAGGARRRRRRRDGDRPAADPAPGRGAPDRAPERAGARGRADRRRRFGGDLLPARVGRVLLDVVRAPRRRGARRGRVGRGLEASRTAASRRDELHRHDRRRGRAARRGGRGRREPGPACRRQDAGRAPLSRRRHRRALPLRPGRRAALDRLVDVLHLRPDAGRRGGARRPRRRRADHGDDILGGAIVCAGVYLGALARRDRPVPVTETGHYSG